MAGRGVMDAAKELQSLVDENKHKITEEGFYLELSNAAMKVHERAAALDETSDASEEEEEEEEDDWYWEDGHHMDAASIASWMIDLVKFDDPDYFVNLVDGLHVCNPMHTRKPKARAIAIHDVLCELDPNDPLDVARMRKWQQHVLSRDGHGRFRYIFKQHWLDEYHPVDADPRRDIIEILELLLSLIHI